MLRYMQALAKVVVKNPVVWAALMVCQMMFLMPFITSEPTWGDHLGQEFLRENGLKPSEDAWARGYPGASPKELEEFETRLNLLREACATDDPREYFELRTDIARQELDQVKRRTLIGPTQLEAESSLRFFERMSGLDDPQIYRTYREAPTWFYLASQHATLPMLAWLAPGLAACACVMHATRGSRLLAQAPMGIHRARVVQMLVVFLSFVAGMILIAVPSALATAFANGLGEMAYPVTNATRSLLLDRTVGETVARALALYSACALFVTFVAFAVAEVLPSRFTVASIAAVAFVCALPLVSDYVELQNAWTGNVQRPSSIDYNLSSRQDFSLYNPMTYLQDAGEVVGYANYFPNAERMVDDRLTMSMGVAVFAGCGAVLWMADAALLSWRNARAGRMDSLAATAEAKRACGLVAHGMVIAHRKNVLMRETSLTVSPGEIVGLVAPNGRGKTTLIEALVGVNGARRAGAIHMDGIGLAKRAGFFQNTLYVPCDASLLYGNLSAADHIKLASTLWRKRVDVDKLIDYCGIGNYLHKPVAFCSSGMKQQIALAVAYCTGVRYLLLDEPMNALDPSNVSLNSTVLERLASQGHGILLSSHILSNLGEVCSSVVFIEGDKLVEHAVDDGDGIKELYEDVYGAPEPARHMEKGGRS